MKRMILVEILIWTLILTFVFSGLFFGYSKIFVEPNVYNIQFKDVDGITVGSPVRYMGINIGYVRRLKTTDKHINLQIIVTKKNMKIPNGTVARVEFYGLGGSKSIELMPPDGSCNVGILTDDTIRILDVVNSAVSFVKILEEIEEYVNSLDKAGMKRFLETIGDFNNSNLQKAELEINKINTAINKQANAINKKERDINNTINNINGYVYKINKFIQK